MRVESEQEVYLEYLNTTIVLVIIAAANLIIVNVKKATVAS